MSWKTVNYFDFGSCQACLHHNLIKFCSVFAIQSNIGPSFRAMVGGQTRPGQDCYFFVYSRYFHELWWIEKLKVSFEAACEVRPVPFATSLQPSPMKLWVLTCFMNQETIEPPKVCTYWLAGDCTKPHCIFRHLEDKRGRWSFFSPQESIDLTFSLPGREMWQSATGRPSPRVVPSPTVHSCTSIPRWSTFK